MKHAEQFLRFKKLIEETEKLNSAKRKQTETVIYSNLAKENHERKKQNDN